MKMENKYLITDDSINLFIEYEHLRDEKKYISSRTKIFYSNISKKKEHVMTYLREYALMNNNYRRNYKDKLPREGYIFNVMLPHGFVINDNKKKLKKYIRHLVKSVSEGNILKYFVVIETVGLAKILKIVMLNRVYYPYGKDVNVGLNENKRIETIHMTTKIRLSHFATKTKNSTSIFKQKLFELKLLFIEMFELSAVHVKEYIRKISYKKIYAKNGLNEYISVVDQLDQRCIIRELHKRKITVINILVDKINYVVSNKPEIADIRGFINKWSNIIRSFKRRKISEIQAIEEQVLEYINLFKTSNFSKI